MKPKKFRKRYIVLIVLVVLLILLAALAFWQRENIKAVQDFASYSQEELEEQMKQNDQAIKDAVNAVPEVSIREVTEEERQALKEGTLSQEELVERLLGTETPAPEQPEPTTTPAPIPTPKQDELAQPSASPTPTPTPTPEPTPTPGKSDYEKRLSELIARVYVLREEYLIQLDDLKEEAIAAYKATPAAQRTASWLTKFVSNYLSKGTALEKQCDQKMDAIVIEMRTLIKENNGDLSLVDTMISTYANEKSLKKAWYMSELEKRGLI